MGKWVGKVGKSSGKVKFCTLLNYEVKFYTIFYSENTLVFTRRIAHVLHKMVEMNK